MTVCSQVLKHVSYMHSLVPQGPPAARQPGLDGCTQGLQEALPGVRTGPSPSQQNLLRHQPLEVPHRVSQGPGH